MLRLLQQVDRRELAGDAVGALELIEADPTAPDGGAMWTGSRISRLLEVDALGPLLPSWAWARWLAVQAVAISDPSGPARTRSALRDAARAGLSGAGVPPAQVLDHDWVFAQTFLHEHGGLADLLARRAAPQVVMRATGVEQPVGAPMGAYRLLGDDATTIRWLDVGAGREVRTVNLGAAATLSPGEHVIGRRVTGGADTLFDRAPLRVADEVAQEVARRPEEWVAVLAGRGESDVGPRVADGSWAVGPSGLLTDLPDSVWRDLALARADLHPAAVRATHGEDPDPLWDPVEEGCVELVLEALDGEVDVPPGLPLRDPWPAVSAALLRPDVYGLVLERLIDEGREGNDLRELGTRLSCVARDLCEAGAALVETDPW